MLIRLWVVQGARRPSSAPRPPQTAAAATAVASGAPTALRKPSLVSIREDLNETGIIPARERVPMVRVPVSFSTHVYLSLSPQTRCTCVHGRLCQASDNQNVDTINKHVAGADLGVASVMAPRPAAAGPSGASAPSTAAALTAKLDAAAQLADSLMADVADGVGFVHVRCCLFARM